MSSRLPIMPIYSIQECKPNHAADLAVLAEKTFRQSYAALNTPQNLEHYIRQALNEPLIFQELKDPHSHYYWITGDDIPVAYLKVNRPPAHTEPGYADGLEVQRIYVDVAHQRQGLGRLLLQLAHTVARNQNLRYLWLGVWERNPQAIRFYQSLGFYQVGSHIFTIGAEDQVDFIFRLDVS